MSKESSGPPPLSQEDRPECPPGPPNIPEEYNYDSRKWANKMANLTLAADCAKIIEILLESGIINEQEAREEQDKLRVLLGLQPRGVGGG